MDFMHNIFSKIIYLYIILTCSYYVLQLYFIKQIYIDIYMYEMPFEGKNYIIYV